MTNATPPRSLLRRRSTGAWPLVALAATVAPARAAAASPGDVPPPPGAPAPRAQAGAGTLTRAPEVIAAPEVPFPEEAGAIDEAEVVVRVLIDTSGEVREVVPAEGAGEPFLGVALDAARALRFRPAEIDGKPAPVRILYRFAFRRPVRVVEVATLAGTVRDRATKKPLAGIVVSEDGGARVVTGDDGRFVFEGLGPGKHRVRLEGPGVSGVTANEDLQAGERLEVRYDVIVEAPRTADDDDDIKVVVLAPTVRRQVVSSEVVAAEAVRLAGTQGDVLKVVDSMPGVGRAAAGSGAVIVWGAAPSETRTYVDGVPVPRLYHAGGIRSVVHPSFVSRVELAPGGYGPSHGRGLGGLLTVETAEPSTDRLHAGAALDPLHASATASVPLGERVVVQAAATRSLLAEVASPFVAQDVQKFFPFPRFSNLQARASYVTAPGEGLSLTYLASSDEIERGVPSADPAAVVRDARTQAMDRLYLRRRTRSNDGATLDVVGFLGREEDVNRQYVGRAGTSLEERVVLGGLRATWNGAIRKGVDLAAGFDGEVRSGDLARTGSLALPSREGDAVVFGQPPPAESARDGWRVLTVGAAPWVRAHVALASDALHLEPGLRFDPNVRSVNRITVPTPEAPNTGAFQVDPRLEARMLVRYAPVEAFEMRAAFAQVSQPAALADSSAVFGSPALPPSEARHGIVGAKVDAGGGFTADTALFYAASEGLAVRNPAASPLLAQALVATGEGRNYGAQLVLRQESRGGFVGWVSYALGRSVRRASDNAAWRYGDFDQTHLLTAVASYDLGAGFDVGLRARYATGFPRTPVIGAYRDLRTDTAQPRFGATNADRLPDFFALDLHAAKTWRFDDQELEIALDVQNATNRSNAEEYVYSADFTRRDVIRGFPLLAMVGLRWKI
jgi:TonB family protein